MSTATAVAAPPAVPWRVGRTFLHPAFDVLVIGGGLSLVLTAFFRTGLLSPATAALGLSLPVLLFTSTLAHFASSTVRLYTKPDAFESHRFLTMGLPLVTMGVLALAVWQPGAVGRHLQALYLTWSPYHYAAQAYGVAVMYCYRSGCALQPAEKTVLRVACFAPFLQNFLSASGAGLEWFVPQTVFLDHPWLFTVRGPLVAGLQALAFLLPAGLFGWLYRQGRPLPLVSLLAVVANGVWWVVLVYADAFVWATVFHGLQYLALVLLFHVREQTARPGNRRSALYHAATFYALSLGLGYLLFQLWPFAFVAAGFGWAESVLLVTATINVHHFVVDAYIWRLRKDPNYRVVTSAPAEAAA